MMLAGLYVGGEPHSGGYVTMFTSATVSCTPRKLLLPLAALSVSLRHCSVHGFFLVLVFVNGHGVMYRHTVLFFTHAHRRQRGGVHLVALDPTEGRLFPSPCLLDRTSTDECCIV